MNSLQIEQLILQRISQWEHFDKNRLARDNRNLKPPNDGVWGRITVAGGINNIASIGNEPCIMQVGTLIIQLFCRENVGTVELKRHADSLAKHLKAYTVDKLELLAPSIINVPSVDGLYQINVSLPYRYY